MNSTDSATRGRVDSFARVDPVRWVPRWARARAARLGALASVLVLGGLMAQELILHGTDIRRWDLLMLSGYLTVILALWLARGQRYRFVSMIHQLHASHALQLDGVDEEQQDQARDELIRASEAEGQLWSNAGSLAIGLLMVVAWPLATADRQPLLAVVGGTALAAVAGYIVGRQVGAFVYYGYWGLTLPQRATLRPQPGHPDDAAGLRPLGSCYFWQAFLLAIPAAFLLVWTLLIPFWDSGRYLDWRPWYQGLLALALALEAVAFLTPLFGVHHQMQRRKTELLGSRAGELARSIERVRRQLEGDLESGQRSNLRDQLEQLTRAYHDIEQMPTWPVDRTIRVRFTTQYGITFVPLIGQWLDGNGSWESLAERLVQ